MVWVNLEIDEHSREHNRLAEFNRIYDFHFHGDDAGIQVNKGNVMGTTLRNNWIHNMPGRNSIRFDGDPAGMGGTVQ